MKVALVHDWVYTFAGAEMVLKHIADIYNRSDLYTVIDFLNAKNHFNINKTNTSFIQSLPFSKKDHRKFLPLMPLAVKYFDLSGVLLP